jgi:hypothetical protein
MRTRGYITTESQFQRLWQAVKVLLTQVRIIAQVILLHHFRSLSVRWRSWLSHLSNTQKVLSSSLGRIILLELKGAHVLYHLKKRVHRVER